MPVMLPVVTPLVALKAVPCSVQGKLLLVTVNVRPSGPVQPLKLSLVIEPRLVPLIPWPLLRLPEELDEVQVSLVPVLVSVSVVVPAFAVMAPPGLMEKVIATARATPALAPTARAVAPPVSRILRESRFRIAIPCLSLIGLPDPARRSGCPSRD